MNREIKFRGISIDEWVYGMLCKVNEGDTEHGEPIKYKIQTEEKEYGEYVQCFITDEKTIGQYTGLHDKNGKEIYEGDIVLYEDWEKAYECRGNDNFINKGIVEYCEDNCCYNVTERQTVDITDVLYKDNEDLEVIGNIYENPELLGGEDEC